MVTLSQLLASLQRLIAADPQVASLPVVIVQEDFGDKVADLSADPATLGFYQRSGQQPELVETAAEMNADTCCVVLWPKA